MTYFCSERRGFPTWGKFIVYLVRLNKSEGKKLVIRRGLVSGLQSQFLLAPHSPQPYVPSSCLSPGEELCGRVYGDWQTPEQLRTRNWWGVGECLRPPLGWYY